MVTDYTQGFLPIHFGLALQFAGPGFEHEFADTYEELLSYERPFPSLRCYVGNDPDETKCGLWYCVEAPGFWDGQKLRYRRLLDKDGSFVGVSQLAPASPGGPAPKDGDRGPKGDAGIGWTIFPDLLQPPAPAVYPNYFALLPLDAFGVWVYDIAAKQWHRLGSLKGPKGNAGERGPQGQTGVQGNQGPAGAPSQRQRLNKEWHARNDTKLYNLFETAYDVVSVHVFTGDAPGTVAAEQGVAVVSAPAYQLVNNAQQLKLDAGNEFTGFYVCYYPLDGNGGYLDGVLVQTGQLPITPAGISSISTLGSDGLAGVQTLGSDGLSAILTTGS